MLQRSLFIMKSNWFFFYLLAKLAVKCSTAEVFWKECYSVIIIISKALICHETKIV